METPPSPPRSHPPRPVVAPMSPNNPPSVASYRSIAHSAGGNSSHQQNNHSHAVELATLILPSHATSVGLEAGDGEKVVLEATQETVNAIATGVVSAVIDLEVLSEMAGVTEQEFIADLHTEVQDSNRVFEQDAAASTPATTEPSAADTNNNGVPHDVAAGETQPLLYTDNDNLNKLGADTPDEVLCDRVTLTADPFIETLAETLHHAEQDTSHIMPTIAEGSILGMDLGSILMGSGQGPPPTSVTAETTTTSPEVELGAVEHAAAEANATKTDADDTHLAHDAFLLNVPKDHGGGELENHFVLALPEIRTVEDTSVLSDVSELQQHHPLLERALSFLPDDLMHLPSDVVHIQIEAHLDTVTVAEQPDEEASSILVAPPSVVVAGSTTVATQPHLHLDLVIQRQVPVIGYIILISGLVALASVGAALDLQHGPSPTLKTLWRQIATSLVLSPLVVQSFVQEGFPKLDRQQWLMLPAAGAAYAYMCLAFVVALDMTTLANAFVLSNMTSLVIIAGRFILRLPVLPSEGMGAILGFIGAAICANDAAKTMAALAGGDVASSSTDAMMGNIIALSASFGTATYLIFAKSLRSSLDIFVFMFSVMFMGSLWLILYMTVTGEKFTLDLDRDIGLFGWLNTDFERLPLELFMAVICNCMGTTGYIAVLKYFEPIVPSSVMLMEPAVGTILGVLAGTSDLPGGQTWFGDLIVAGGTFLVIWSGSKKTEKIDAEAALRPSHGDDDDASTIVTFKSSLMPPKVPPVTGDSAAKVVWDS